MELNNVNSKDARASVLRLMTIGFAILALSSCTKSVEADSAGNGNNPGGDQGPIDPGSNGSSGPPENVFNGNKCQVYDLRNHLINLGCIEQVACSGGHCFRELHAQGTPEWTACRTLPNLDAQPPPGSELGHIDVRWFDVRDIPFATGYPYLPEPFRTSMTEYYALNCNGWLDVPAAGVYDFLSFTNGGFRFIVNGATVIANEVAHDQMLDLNSATLAQGLQSYKIHWYQGAQDLLATTLYWKSTAMDPNADYVVIPPTAWFREP